MDAFDYTILAKTTFSLCCRPHEADLKLRLGGRGQTFYTQILHFTETTGESGAVISKNSAQSQSKACSPVRVGVSEKHA